MSVKLLFLFIANTRTFIKFIDCLPWLDTRLGIDRGKIIIKTRRCPFCHEAQMLIK